MQQVTELHSLRNYVQNWQSSGHLVALVPTMGALHAGHMALVAEAKRRADKVVVSIFVNPTQFGPNEDFNQYPRTEQADAQLCLEHGVDALWLPSADIMYPQGFSTRIDVGEMADALCGKFRTGHFSGVATVVAKLCLQVQPNMAVFGEKDYQQLQVITRMVTDLNLPVQIVGVPTQREVDGLALSSRNRYLNDEQRATAPELYKALNVAADELRAGRDVAGILEASSTALLACGFAKLDYFAYVDAQTLAPLTKYQPAGRLCVAAFLGSTRLIDNIEV